MNRLPIKGEHVMDLHIKVNQWNKALFIQLFGKWRGGHLWSEFREFDLHDFLMLNCRRTEMTKLLNVDLSRGDKSEHPDN